MAPPFPLPEQAGESAAPTPADAQRSLPTPFLTKTYQLVDDPAIDDLISWSENGSTFVVWRPAEFARDLLPKYFKHNNFSSFVRQLNTYGFRKTVPDRWEFANDCFRRGEKRLLCDIHRRKIQFPATPPAAVTVAAVPANRVASPTNSGDEQTLSSNLSQGAAPGTSVRGGGGASPELVEDNHRLRKENERLKHELSQMKNLCNGVLVLMSKYSTQQQPSAGVGGCVREAEEPPPPSCPLELMPLTRFCGASEPANPGGGNHARPDGDDDDELEDREWEGEEKKRNPRPRLFGVHIGDKRARGREEEPEADEQPRLRPVVEAKAESVDPCPVEPPAEGPRHRWRIFDGGRRPSNQRVCN